MPTLWLRTGLALAFGLATGAEYRHLKIWQDKDRDTSITEAPRDRYNLTAADRQGYDQFARNPTEFVVHDRANRALGKLALDVPHA